MNRLTIECEVHFTRRGMGSRKELEAGAEPVVATEPGRVPRVAKLMALALRFEDLLQQRVVADYAELARLGHVSRARITQVMNLLLLAPDLQEMLLFLPRTRHGRDPIRLLQLQQIVHEVSWARQRRRWQELSRHLSGPAS